jgi:hypothetical protein
MKSLLLFLAFFYSCWVHAQELPQRSVNMDWDPIEGASSYDIEFVAKPKFKKLFTIKKPEWKGKLKPGNYEMRIRAKDRRQVPGEWSGFEPIVVQLEKIEWLTAESHWKFDSTDPDSWKVKLNWKSVPGAKSYLVNYESEDQSIKKSIEVSTSSAEIETLVAHKYSVRVEALGPNELRSEAPGEGSFEILGPTLTTPKLSKPENKFVRQLEWNQDSHAKTANLKISWKDEMTGRWKEMTSENIDGKSSFALPAEWPGGIYRVALKNDAPLRKTSKSVSMEFPVQNGDRSPAAEYVSLIRESIERTRGWFAIASYLVTGLSYTGVNSDNAAGNGLKVQFPQNFGGTGRLGLGFLSENSLLGFLGIIDLSGFTVKGKNPTFASSEANVVLRNELGSLGEFRQHYGVFYKEVPEIIALNTDEIASISKIASLGPHAGVEYWIAVSPKLGLQVNGHIYPNLISIKTPNGNPIATSISYQLGLLGSYRLGRRTTGLMGYAYRRDSMAYQSQSGKTNTIDLTGHYLNLFLEWSL